MAVKVEQKSYILKKERKNYKTKNPLELKNMSNEQIIAAVRLHGTEAIIHEYREADRNPPVDLLLGYLEHNPDKITDKERLLLQKAYGRDFMAAQYARLGVGALVKQSWGSRLLGSIGRAVGHYKRLKVDEAGLVLKTLDAATDVLLKGIHKMEQNGGEKEAGSLDVLMADKINIADRSLQAEEDKSKDVKTSSDDVSQEGQITVPVQHSPSMLQKAAGEEGGGSEGKVQEEKEEAVQKDDFIEDWKSYHSFIHLHGYSAKRYRYGMIQIVSPEIALGIGSFELFTLKDTDFIINYDPESKSETVSMSKGSGSIQLGALTITATKMSYTDLDATFTAESVGAKLESENFLNGSVEIKDVTLDSTGIHFKDFTVKLSDLNVFDGALTVENPVFHMTKKDTAWMKDISIGGLAVDANELFSLKLGKAGKTDEGGAEAPQIEDNQNAWMLREESSQLQVSGNASKWRPNIQNATADLSIGEGFHASLEKITFDSKQMSAEIIKAELKGSFADSQFTAEATAENAGYDFGTRKPYLDQISGSVELVLGGNSLLINLTGMNYSEGTLRAETVSGLLKLQETDITLQGTGLSYSKEGVFDFIRLSGSLDKEMHLLDVIVLKGISASVEKQGNQEGGEESQDSGQAYNISIEAKEGELDTPGFKMGIKQAQFSLSEHGELGSGEITDASLNINDGLIEGSSASLCYSKEEGSLSANDVALSLHLGETKQLVTISTMKYENTNGFSMAGMDVRVQLDNLGGNSMEAELKNASCNKTDGLKAETASVKTKLMGQEVTLIGTDLGYTPKKEFTFGSLEAQLGDWEDESGFTLKGAKLKVTKDESGAYIVEASGNTVSLTASGITLSAQTTNFVVSNNKLSKADITDAVLDFGGGIFKATAENVTYLNDESIHVSVQNLALKKKSEGGIDADFTIDSGSYDGKEFTLNGLNGTLTASLLGTDFAASMKDGAYVNDVLKIGEASVGATILGQQLNLTGTGVQYSKAEGLDFDSLQLTTGEPIHIGSVLTIEDGSMLLDKKNTKAPLTISGKAAATIDQIATMDLKVDELCLSSTRVYSAKMSGASLNIGKGMFTGSLKTISYSADDDSFSAEDLSGAAKLGNQSLDVSAKSLTYENKDLSLAGVAGAADFRLGSTSIHIDFRDGDFENQQLTIETATSNLKIMDTEIELHGDTLVFSKEALSFKLLSGEIKEPWTPYEGSGITITGVKVSVEKNGENYKTELSSDSVVIQTSGVKLSADKMNFQIENGQLQSAQVKSAAMDINKGMITGSVEDFKYAKEESGYSFASGKTTAALNTGDMAAGSVTVDSIGYQDKEFTFANMEAIFSLKLGGNSMEAKFNGASYDITDGLKATTASVSANVLTNQINLTGEGLALSPDKKFNFTTLSATLEKDLNCFNIVLLKGVTADVTKDESGTSVTLSAGVSTVDKKTFDLSADAVKTTLTDHKLQDIVISEASLNIKNGLITIGSKEVNLSFVEEKLSAKNLEINVDSQALGEVTALRGIRNFLTGIGVTVGELTYSKDGGLTYADFAFKGSPIPLSVGEFLTLTPDLEKRSFAAKIGWMFPGGQMVSSKEDEKSSEAAGQDGAKVSEGSGKAQKSGGEKYRAPSLFEFPKLEFPIVPGISLSAAVDMGAGFYIQGGVKTKKFEENAGGYHLKGNTRVAGEAYLGASIGLTAGVSYIANITAALVARLGLDLGADADIKMDVSFRNKLPAFSNASASYKASMDASISIDAMLSAKFLFFESKTLYEKNLSKWDIGKFAVEGSFGVDEKTGEIKVENVKKNMKINDKEISEGVFDRKNMGENKEAVGVIEKGKEEKTVLETESQMAERQRLQDKMEAVLLNENVVWGTDGGGAADILVEKMKQLTELYAVELTSISDRIVPLKERIDVLRLRSSINRKCIKADEQIQISMKQRIDSLSDTFDRPVLYGTIFHTYEDELERKYLQLVLQQSIELQKPLGVKDDEDAQKKMKIIMNRYTETDRIRKIVESEWKKAKSKLAHDYKDKSPTTDIIEAANLAEHARFRAKQHQEREKIHTKFTGTIEAKEVKDIFVFLTSGDQDDVFWEKKELEFIEGAYNKDMARLADAEIEKGELANLQVKMNSFLSVKAHTGNLNERKDIKDICEDIRNRKIAKNLKELKESEKNMSELVERNKQNKA